MTTFDPYHKWLGIPPGKQHPNYYCLLGLRDFESDVEVIDTAANKQMSYLHSCATGEHAALAERLLNEIATARLSLLNPRKKSAYDIMLQKRVTQPDHAEVSEPDPGWLTEPETASPAILVPKSSSKRRSKKFNLHWLLICGFSFVVLVGGLMLFLNRPSTDYTTSESADRTEVSTSDVIPQEIPTKKSEAVNGGQSEDQKEPEIETPKDEVNETPENKANSSDTKWLVSTVIDLLSELDVSKSSAGDWSKNRNVVRTTVKKKVARLSIPNKLPKNYDLEVKFTISGDEPYSDTYCILPIMNKSVPFTIRRKDKKTCLGFWGSGQFGSNKNICTYVAWQNGVQTHELIFKVRNNQVAVIVGGATVVDIQDITSIKNTPLEPLAIWSNTPTLLNTLKAQVEAVEDKKTANKKSGETTDLLAVIREALLKDSNWSFNKDSLTGNNLNKAEKLDTKYQLHNDYDLTAEFRLTKTNGGNDTIFVLPTKDKSIPFAVRHLPDGRVLLSAWPNNEKREDFGKSPYGINLDQRFSFSKQRSLTFKVRSSGIEIILDGTTLHQLSNQTPVKTSDDQTLQLNSSRNQVVFDKLSVTTQ